MGMFKSLSQAVQASFSAVEEAANATKEVAGAGRMAANGLNAQAEAFSLKQQTKLIKRRGINAQKLADLYAKYPDLAPKSD